MRVSGASQIHSSIKLLHTEKNSLRCTIIRVREPANEYAEKENIVNL
jgi:hypothetical protein